MTRKTFIKKLISIIEKDGSFITWDNKDKDFADIDDNVVVVCGDSEREVFTLIITKVE